MVTNQTQDGITTAADAELACYLCSCLSSHDQSKLTEGFLQPDGALGMRIAQLWKPFRKNLLRTGPFSTEETAHVNDEMDRTSTSWKIMQHACVSALYARRVGSTRRTCSR